MSTPLGGLLPVTASSGSGSGAEKHAPCKLPVGYRPWNPPPGRGRSNPIRSDPIQHQGMGECGEGSEGRSSVWRGAREELGGICTKTRTRAAMRMRRAQCRACMHVVVVRPHGVTVPAILRSRKCLVDAHGPRTRAELFSRRLVL